MINTAAMRNWAHKKEVLCSYAACSNAVLGVVLDREHRSTKSNFL